MTITCAAPEVFSAHRAIICPQSTFFDTAIAESDLHWNVHLAGENPENVKRLLEFFYTGTYQDGLAPVGQKPGAVGLMSRAELMDDIEATTWDTDSDLTVGRVKDWGYEEYNECGECGRASDSDSEIDAVMEVVENDEDDSDDSESESEETSSDEISDDEGITISGKILDVDTFARSDCKVLFVHLRLYVLADKYDIQPLRLLARNRFKTEAEIIHYSSPRWFEVVEELFSTTRVDDDLIREVPSVLSAAMAHSPGYWKGIRPIMQKHGDFAVRVMEDTFGNYSTTPRPSSASSRSSPPASSVSSRS